MFGLLNQGSQGGLLDDPRQVGLLNTALSLLASSGPSTTPTSLGQAFGRAGAQGMQSYQAARQRQLDQEKEKLQSDLLNQQIAQATRKNTLINNMLEQYSGLQNAPIQALSDGSKMGSVGPTNDNAARLEIIRKSNTLYGIPPEAIANDLATNDGKNIGEWIFKRGIPDMQVSNGYAYNKNDLRPGFLPSLNVSQNGQATVTNIDANGSPVVSAPPGALDTYRSYQGAEARERAKSQLLPLDYARTSGEPVGGSIGDYLDSNNPNAVGLDTRRLTPQQQLQLQRTDPEAFSNGVSRFTQGIVPSSGLQSSAGREIAKGRADTQVLREKEMPIAENAAQTSIYNLDRLTNEAKDILNNKSLSRVTGVTGKFPNIPGSDAADVQARIENLKSQTGINALSAMRDASKTGGAVGNVTEKEWPILQGNIAGLDQNQSWESYKSALKRIIDHNEATKERILSTYKNTYGRDLSYSPNLNQPSDTSKEIKLPNGWTVRSH